MNLLRTTCVAAVAAALLASQLASADPPAATAPVILPWGFDIAGMDRSVAPGDDFFRYAGGTWLATTQIPGDRSSFGSFDVLAEKADADVRAIIQAVALQSNTPDSIEQKVADFYAAYLNTDRIEALGTTLITDDLHAIAGVDTYEAMARMIARPEIPTNGPVSISLTIDDKDPNRYVIGINQSGLGMGDRDYYLKADETYATIREKYRAYIEKALTLAGWPDATQAATDILALETRIAELQWPYEKQRERELNYNPKTRAELLAFAPEYPWAEAFETLSLQSVDFFLVAEAEPIQNLAKLFRETPLATWRSYLAFHYVNGLADILPKTFDEARFDFFGRTLAGQPTMRERWKRAVTSTNNTIGEAVGQLYVARHFSADAKIKMTELVENLRAAYRQRIQALTWMSEETKQAALRKLEAMRLKIGYPDKWIDYSALEVRADEAIGNRMRASAWSWARDLKRLAGPTDKGEWLLAPQEVNAYNNFLYNEIVFPAAILQPPFFDPNADPAVNYGAIGGVIGHEMGHGFDDQGSKSDENGVMRTWWTTDDAARFGDMTRRLVDQYSLFEPLPGLHLNGGNTVGENIADIGGMSVAMEAYRLSLRGGEAPVLDGFTGEQRVFLGWAQIWRDLFRPEALRDLILTNEHSPSEFRVNGPVRNMDSWYEAFGVGPEAKLYLKPGERVQIW